MLVDLIKHWKILKENAQILAVKGHSFKIYKIITLQLDFVENQLMKEYDINIDELMKGEFKI